MPGTYGHAAQAANNRDSNALRASVLDVFVQLGALQKNSLITQWMFEEEEHDGSLVEQRGRHVAREEPRYAYGYGGYEERDTRMASEDHRIVDGDSTQETRRGGRSKFTSKITAVFRGRSRSKTRTGKGSRNPIDAPPPPPPPPPIPVSSPVPGYETDEGYTSSSTSKPGKRSKSRRRGVTIFPMSPRPSESSESSFSPATTSEYSSRPSYDRSRAVSPTSDLSVPFPSIPPVPTTVNANTISGGRRSKEKSVVKKVEVTAVKDEEWEQFPPLTPGAFAPNVLAGPPDKKISDMGENSEAPEAGTLLKRLSFAIPRTNFQNPIKRRKSRRPPSLLPISNPSEEDEVSKSLPSSPFILVTPEIGEAGSTGVDTPYIVCTPIDDKTARSRLSQPLQPTDSPVYPLSVSKTIRRSLVLDNMNHSDENLPMEHALDSGEGKARLNRAVSMQAPSAFTSRSQARVNFADGERPGLRRSLSQRARDAPFPTRPILPVPLSLSIHGPNARAVRLSLDARASVIRQRYRNEIGRDN